MYLSLRLAFDCSVNFCWVEWTGSWKSTLSLSTSFKWSLSLFISSYPMTLMKPGRHLIHRCISEADIRAWWVVGSKVTVVKLVSWTAVMLLQRSSEAPAPSLVLSLFILKTPFGVNCILVHVLYLLFRKLWVPREGSLPSILWFPDSWRHAFKLSGWSNWSDWLLDQWVL